MGQREADAGSAMGSQGDRQEQLWELIRKGPLTEVHAGEEAWAIAEAISTHLEAIRESPYDSLLGRLQAIMADHLTLCVSRLFESHPTYDTRGIPDILDFVEQHSAEFKLCHPRAFQEALARWPNPPSMEGRSDQRFHLEVVQFLREKVPSSETIEESANSLALWKARQRRNKRIAHNEVYKFSDAEKASWHELVSLIRLGRDIASPVSIGYANTVFSWPPTDFVLQGAAEGNAYRLLNLLKQAGAIDEAGLQRIDIGL